MEMLTVHKLGRLDKLETLSAYYRVPVCMIMRANAFADPEEIFTCKEIKIPRRCYCNRCAGQPGPGVKYALYTVREGDTLYRIARCHGVTMHILLKTNGLGDADGIRPGDRLCIPVLQGRLYSVRDGESLKDIAQRHGLKASDIREKNCIEGDVHPGMQLIL